MTPPSRWTWFGILTWASWQEVREGLLTQIKCRSSPNMVWFLLTASFSEDLGGVVNLVDKYGYDIDEGMIPRKLY